EIVAIEGFASGNIIFLKIKKSPAPSILADSSKLIGRPWKKLRIIIILKAFTAIGKIIAHNVSISPSELTTKNVGIIPPLNNIVNTTAKLIKRLPGKYDLDKPYAIIDV